jgi:hypothetical protein
MRVRIDKVCEFFDEPPVYRVVEQDGAPVTCWLPGLEHSDPEGDLDRGGFSERNDALAFALGVDRWRAEHGLIAETVEAIDIERHSLDHCRAAEAKKLKRQRAA